MLANCNIMVCIKFSAKNEIKCNKVCKMWTKADGESGMSKIRVNEGDENDERPDVPALQ